MSERVSMNVNGGVADVRLTRADKLNALDFDMFCALTDVGQALTERKDVRAVVLSGDGRAFCAGLDFSMFASMLESSGGSTTNMLERRADMGPANRVQYVCTVWQDIPVPVIAALTGVAFGGGLQIALGADMRYAAPDARLALREINWGIIPDMAGSQLLRHLVGLDVAKELTFTGREVSGEEALRMGLVTRLCDDPRKEALATAAAIAQRSPHAIRAAKAMLNGSVQVGLAEGLELEERLQRTLLGGHNQKEAVMAGLAKRPPVFVDPD